MKDEAEERGTEAYLLIFNVFAMFFRLFIIPIAASERPWKHFYIEIRLYPRRRLVSHLFTLPQHERRSTIQSTFDIIEKRVRDAELDFLAAESSSYIVNPWCEAKHYLFTWYYEPQLSISDELLNAETSEEEKRVLYRLGFIDASRFGSFMTPALHTHLLNIHDEWKTLSQDDEWISPTGFTQAKHPEEMDLLNDGVTARKMAQDWKDEQWHWPWPVNDWHEDPCEHVYPRTMLPRKLFAYTWSVFEGDDLDFVRFGPSPSRSQRILSPRYRWRACGHAWIEVLVLGIQLWIYLHIWCVMMKSLIFG